MKHTFLLSQITGYDEKPRRYRIERIATSAEHRPGDLKDGDSVEWEQIGRIVANGHSVLIIGAPA